jgi:hypothetical protein
MMKVLLKRLKENLGLFILLAFILLAPLSWFGWRTDVAVLWLTGVAVAIYTMETQRMRLELVRQNEMAVRPLIIATIAVEESQGIAQTVRKFIAVKNIGRGPALFLQAEDITVSDDESREYQLHFKPIDHLTAEESEELVVDAKLSSKPDKQDPKFGSKQWLLEHFDPQYAKKPTN